jgi:hypothetical protein
MDKNSMLERKTVEKFYLDNEEITEGEYKAVQKYITRFCNFCQLNKDQKSRLVETSTGGNSTTYQD